MRKSFHSHEFTRSYELQVKKLRNLLECAADKEQGTTAASTYGDFGKAVEKSDLAISAAGFLHFTQDYVTAVSFSFFVCSVLGNPVL